MERAVSVRCAAGVGRRARTALPLGPTAVPGPWGSGPRTEQCPSGGGAQRGNAGDEARDGASGTRRSAGRPPVPDPMVLGRLTPTVCSCVAPRTTICTGTQPLGRPEGAGPRADAAVAHPPALHCGRRAPPPADACVAAAPCDELRRRAPEALNIPLSPGPWARGGMGPASARDGHAPPRPLPLRGGRGQACAPKRTPPSAFAALRGGPSPAVQGRGIGADGGGPLPPWPVPWGPGLP